MKRAAFFCIAAGYILFGHGGAVLAADGSKPVPPQFFEQMLAAASIRPTESAVLPQDDRGVLSGYYRVEITSSGANQILSLKDSICRKAFGNGSQLKDVLFDRKYDMGLQATVALDTSGDGNAPQLAELVNKVEIVLFRLRRSEGACVQDRSYFVRNPNGFKSPWRPLDSGRGGKLLLWIYYTPWANRTENQKLVDLLWGGVEAAANLVGPISALGTFFDDNKGTAMAAANRVAGIGAASDSGDAMLRSLALSSDVSNFKRQTLAFDWNAGVGPAPAFKANYSISVAYRGSMLTISQQEKIPAMTPALRAEIIGKGQKETTPAVKAALANLMKQDKIELFDAACSPLLSAADAAGLSIEDRTALAYAAGGKFPDGELAKLTCLNDYQSRAALKRWSVTLPNLTIATASVDAIDAAKKLINALKAPSTNAATTLGGYLDEKVAVGGEASMLTGSGAVASAEQVAAPVNVASANFVVALQTKAAFQASDLCIKEDREDTPANILHFPLFSGMQVGNDRILVVPIGDSSGTWRLVIAALKGKKPDGTPIVDRLWIGVPKDKQVADMVPLLQAIAGMPGCPWASMTNLHALLPPPPAPVVNSGTVVPVAPVGAVLESGSK